MKKCLMMAVVMAVAVVWAQGTPKAKISLAEARSRIDKIVASPTTMGETMKALSAEDQKTFLADLNKAVSEMPGSAEEKAAVFLTVNTLAVANAEKGNATAIFAEVFATVPPEALTVLSERLPVDLLTRQKDANTQISDEQYEKIALSVMEKVNERCEETDNGSSRATLAILTLVRASGGTSETLTDTLIDTLKHEDAKETAREMWIPDAQGADGREKSYESMREVASQISRRARAKIRRFDGTSGIFDHYGVERQLQDAFAREVKLKSGGYLVIDETEALIAVDVNTGHYKGKGSQEDAIREVNLEAVDEVARQLRLRNIGGLVILDLIDMKSRKHQREVVRALKDALRRDRARTNVLDISELGLLEMSRQRQDSSILSQLTSTCPYCQGHGLVKSPMAVSIEIQRHLIALLKKSESEKKPFEPKIVIAPQVMQRLRTEDSDILARLQKDFNTRLTFVSELHRHPEAFSILDAATSQVLYSQT